ncbi:M16 family metallopeptidase [Streptomyces millisiae]|uniref:Pitrilysin family protein n=1 Tax=Streptomyces millisiae TaxID=3075542 RepID=A0ABU2LU14_9ACTN|nr:pitrilysin family protein [Streptomyces sp. DSM 44918]MDT0321031.1 pitrilysin family protein [Streptomyces sp. DSM 44918]
MSRPTGTETARPTDPVGRAVPRPRHSDGTTVQRTVLPSGLRILTETVPGVRSVSFGIWARVGSRDETPAQGGATHYLEHLLFKGTSRRSALEISSAIDAVGGEMNAFTTKEFTCYYARVLDSDLPLAVDIVCDMLTGSLIPAEEVDAERDVILEEIAMTEDDPSDGVHDLFAHTLFGDSPLGRPVLGTVDTVNALTRDRIARFYRRHYDPTRLVVTVAGNAEHATVVDLVTAAFDRAGASGPGAEPVGPRSGHREVRPAGRVDIVERRTEQAHLVLGMPGVSRHDERRWALGVLSTALGGGMSSRLFQEIREKRGLAYNVYAHTSGYADCGLFGVYAGCRPDRLDQVLDICRQQLAEVAEKGLGDEEVERAIGQLAGSTVLGLEDTGSLMHRLGKSEICWGQQLSVDELLAHIAAVTPDDVRRVAREVLGQRPSLSVIGPLNDRRAARLTEAMS